MSELKHLLNCGAPIEACSCCLNERVTLQTERELHAAWRKRAEEAEQRIASLEAENAELRKLRDEVAAKGLTAEMIRDHYPRTQHQEDECQLCHEVFELAAAALQAEGEALRQPSDQQGGEG